MLRAVIFDYGNTLIGIDPTTPSTRTDYADVVARPGAERLAEHLRAQGVLDGSARAARFADRFLEIRERNRLTAEQTGREITATESLDEALTDASAKIPETAAGAARLAEALHVYFSVEERHLIALDGALESLAFLRDRGIPTALLSNATDGRYVERVATRLGMRPFLDPFVVSADIGIRKPRSEAFRAVLDRWTVPLSEVVMVGDSLHHDVEGAQKLGLLTIHFTQLPNPFDSEHVGRVVPTAAARDHAELRDVLQRLGELA